jgi:AraC family transcriptional regulator of adaptative response/methylated-DNA-[protein]-cysteine methyltransferase
MQVHAICPAHRGKDWELVVGCGLSRFGPAWMAEGPAGLCELGFGKPPAWQECWPAARLREDDARAAKVLAAVESGRVEAVVLCGTDFQVAVWRALLAIPCGETVSYGELARRLGRPAAARAVGRAVGANRLAWVVPCHRVVGTGRRLGGYRWGLELKRAMLDAERAQDS